LMVVKPLKSSTGAMYASEGGGVHCPGGGLQRLHHHEPGPTNCRRQRHGAVAQGSRRTEQCGCYGKTWLVGSRRRGHISHSDGDPQHHGETRTNKPTRWWPVPRLATDQKID